MYHSQQYYITDVPYFVVDQNIHTIPKEIHYSCQPELWNVIILAVANCIVFLDLQCIFGNHIVTDIMLHLEIISLAS